MDEMVHAFLVGPNYGEIVHDESGVEAVYLGRAGQHLHSFEVLVPNTSAPRVTNTVWWFLHDKLAADDGLLRLDSDLTYPPSKARPNPRDNGTDLIGRAFLEPDRGVCMVTGAGPVVHNTMASQCPPQAQPQF
jgi:hypothetical protein